MCPEITFSRRGRVLDVRLVRFGDASSGTDPHGPRFDSPAQASLDLEQAHISCGSLALQLGKRRASRCILTRPPGLSPCSAPVRTLQSGHPAESPLPNWQPARAGPLGKGDFERRSLCRALVRACLNHPPPRQSRWPKRAIQSNVRTTLLGRTTDWPQHPESLGPASSQAQGCLLAHAIRVPSCRTLKRHLRPLIRPFSTPRGPIFPSQVRPSEGVPTTADHPPPPSSSSPPPLLPPLLLPPPPPPPPSPPPPPPPSLAAGRCRARSFSPGPDLNLRARLDEKGAAGPSAVALAVAVSS